MKTGTFQDSNEVYHSQEHIGSTSLKAMLLSPAHFYEAWKGPKKESHAFDEGNAVHSALLERNLDGFIRRPAGLDGRTKAGRAALEELEASGKIVIASDIYDSMERRLDAFVKSSEAMRVYNGAKIEQSYYVQDHDSGLYLKCRPDMDKAAVMGDLKTTSFMARFQIEIFSKKYHIQAGFYSLVREMVTGIPVREFKFIAQEKTAPYAVKVFNLYGAELEWCKTKARELINRAGVCVRENSFPGYDDVEIAVEIPEWTLVENSFDFEVA